jgi:small subunit ribosomal protein S21
MAIRIKSRHNESVAQMLRRFKKLCEKEGLTKDIKRRQYYEKPSERARRDARRSFSRNTMGPMRNDRTEGGSSGGGRMARGPVGRSGSGPKGARGGRGGAKGGRSGPGGRGPGGRSGGGGRPSGPRRPSF